MRMKQKHGGGLQLKIWCALENVTWKCGAQDVEERKKSRKMEGGRGFISS